MQTMKKLFLILSVAAGLVSCEDFLTAGDPNKIDAPPISATRAIWRPMPTDFCKP